VCRKKYGGLLMFNDKNEKVNIDELFSDLDELEFTEIKEVTALPETAATSGSMFSNGCSTCGSSSCCSSST
jgi:hypothetical protein